MIVNTILGQSCLKYRQIAISDTATELTKEVNKMSVELPEFDGAYMHVMNIDIPVLGIQNLRLKFQWNFKVWECFMI